MVRGCVSEAWPLVGSQWHGQWVSEAWSQVGWVSEAWPLDGWDSEAWPLGGFLEARLLGGSLDGFLRHDRWVTGWVSEAWPLGGSLDGLLSYGHRMGF